MIFIDGEYIGDGLEFQRLSAHLINKHNHKVYLLRHKHFLKRLDREGMLGKKMVTGADINLVRSKFKNYL